MLTCMHDAISSPFPSGLEMSLDFHTSQNIRSRRCKLAATAGHWSRLNDKNGEKWLKSLTSSTAFVLGSRVSRRTYACGRDDDYRLVVAGELWTHLASKCTVIPNIVSLYTKFHF